MASDIKGSSRPLGSSFQKPVQKNNNYSKPCNSSPSPKKTALRTLCEQESSSARGKTERTRVWKKKSTEKNRAPQSDSEQKKAETQFSRTIINTPHKPTSLLIEKKPVSPLFQIKKEKSSRLTNTQIRYMRWLLQKSYLINSKDGSNLNCVLLDFLKGIEKQVYEKKGKTPWHLNFALCGSAAGKLFAVDDQINDIDLIFNVELEFDYTHLDDIEERNNVLEREMKKIFNIVRNAIETELDLCRMKNGAASLPLEQIYANYFKKYERHLDPIQWDRLSESPGKRYTLYSMGKDKGLTLDFKTVINITFKKEGRENCWVPGVQDFSAFNKDSFLIALDPCLKDLWTNLRVISTAGPIETAFKELREKKLATPIPNGNKLFAALKAITSKGFSFENKAQQAIGQDFVDHFINESLEMGLVQRFDPFTISKPYAILSLINLLHACDEILSLNPDQKNKLKGKLSALLPFYIEEEISLEMQALFFSWCRLSMLLSNPSEKEVIPISLQDQLYYLYPPDDCIELFNEFAKQETEEMLSLCNKAFPLLSKNLKNNQIRPFLIQQMKELILKRYGLQLPRCLRQLISEGGFLSLEVARLIYQELDRDHSHQENFLDEALLLKLTEHVAAHHTSATFDDFWAFASRTKCFRIPECLLSAQIAVFKNYSARNKDDSLLIPLMNEMLECCKRNFCQKVSGTKSSTNRSKKIQRKAQKASGAGNQRLLSTNIAPTNAVPKQEIRDLAIAYLHDLTARATSFEELEIPVKYFLKLIAIPFEKKEYNDLIELFIQKANALAAQMLKPSSGTLLFDLLSSVIDEQDGKKPSDSEQTKPKDPVIIQEDYLTLLDTLLSVNALKGKKLLESLLDKNLLTPSEKATQCVSHFLAQFLTNQGNQKHWKKTVNKCKAFISNDEQKRELILAIIEKCKPKNLLLLREICSSLFPMDWLNLNGEKEWLATVVTPLYLKEIHQNIENEKQFFHLMDHLSWLITSGLLPKTEANYEIVYQLLKQWAQASSIISTERHYQKIYSIYQFLYRNNLKNRDFDKEVPQIYLLIKGCFNSYDTALIKQGERLLRQANKEKLFSSDMISLLYSALIHAERRLSASSRCDELLTEAIEKGYLSINQSPHLLLKAYEDVLQSFPVTPVVSVENAKKQQTPPPTSYEKIREQRIKELLEIKGLRNLVVQSIYPRSFAFMTSLIEHSLSKYAVTHRRTIIGFFCCLYKMHNESLFEDSALNQNKLIETSLSLFTTLANECDLPDWSMMMPFLLVAHHKKIFKDHPLEEAKIYTKAITASMSALKKFILLNNEKIHLANPLLESLAQFIPSFQTGDCFTDLQPEEKEIFINSYLEHFLFFSQFDNSYWEKGVALFDQLYQPNATEIKPALARSQGYALESFIHGLTEGRGFAFLLAEPLFTDILSSLEECLEPSRSQYLFNVDHLTIQLLYLYLAASGFRQNHQKDRIQKVLELVEKQTSSSKDMHQKVKDAYQLVLSDLSSISLDPQSPLFITYLKYRAIKAKILDEQEDKLFFDALTLQQQIKEISQNFTTDLFTALSTFQPIGSHTS